MSTPDLLAFIAFFAVVISLAIYKSRRARDHDENSADFFLGGRSLTWPIIGISIVAANISSEQMVGMAGAGAANQGLAVSSWQLMGSVFIVLISMTLLPRFLKAGIYTMPEFLEYRYNTAARSIMAILTVVIYVGVLLTAVLYTGATALSVLLDVPMHQGVWIIGAIGTLYAASGGLKAIAYADLIQGIALLIGGMLIFFLGLRASGGWSEFTAANPDKLKMLLFEGHPGHDELPWHTVFSGMWIVMIYYCGLNQFIVQRNLAAKTLRDGQLGMIFAGALWLLVPFAIVMPGIMANSHFKPQIAAEADLSNDKLLQKVEAGTQENYLAIDPAFAERRPDAAREALAHNAGLAGTPVPETTDADAVIKANEKLLKTAPGAATDSLAGYKFDAAYPVLIKHLIGPGLRGFIFAAIAGAIVSTLASLLNSSSTIASIDVYKRLINPEASDKTIVLLGRILTLAFVVLGCLTAPLLSDQVFQFIQKFQGFIWPGVVAAFLGAFVLPRAPGSAGVTALVLGPFLYAAFQILNKDGLFTHVLDERVLHMHFLTQVLTTFGIIFTVMIAITLVRPLPEPRTLPVREHMDLKTDPVVKISGALVIAAVAVFFAVFW